MQKLSIKSLFLIINLSIITLLSSCGSGSESSSTSGSTGVSGLAQKGPFYTGGTATAYQLVNGARGGSSATATISNDSGAYSFANLNWSGATEIEVVGFYFDENNNTKSATVGTLTTVINVANKSQNQANVNVLTNLATKRIKSLLIQQDSEAYIKAQNEAKALFGIDASVNIDEINLVNKGDNAAAVAELIKISAAIAASPTILTTLTDEMQGGGDVRGGATFQSFLTGEYKDAGDNFATLTANIGSLTGVVITDLPTTSDISTNTAPVNSFATSTITIDEDSLAITRTLTATDADSDTITFSAEISTAIATVSVSGDELTITPVANANGSANILVISTDGKFNTYSEIPLTITAVNDTPTITANQSFSIAENSPSGSPVGTVVATDVETNTFTWAIASGNTNTAFAISNTGQITVEGSLDKETIGSYNLGITANDGSDTSDEVVVVVNITNINEAPTLTKPNNISSTYGTNATTITLSGSDVDANTTLVYSTSSSSDAIATTSVSGADLTIAPKGYGTATITVEVSDGEFSASQTLTFFVAKKDITITINDKTRAYNTANPTFDHNNNGVVSGDSLSGTLSTVATLTSTVGEYAITGSLSNVNYNITMVNGTLTIAKADQDAISVDNITKQTVDADFTPNATGGNGDGTITATLSSNSSVATITASGQVDILSAGNTTISVVKLGGTNYNDSDTTTFVLTVEAGAQQASGVAVDGFLARSDVCLDLNINDACDEGEPSAKTSNTGAYTLTFTAQDQAKPNFKTSPILVVGGTDIGLDTSKPDNKPFTGSLKALNTIADDEAVAEINLSPATKMLATGAMKQRAANSATFNIADLNGFIAENEPKVKKAMKIPDDKPLTVDLSKDEFRASYQQALSIHKSLETMVEAQVQAKKATTQTITAVEAMDDMYSLAFDTILDDDFAANLVDGATLSATTLLDHMQTDSDIKNNIPEEAKKVIDRAKKIGETIHSTFEGFDGDNSVDLAEINKIEDVIKLEFDKFEKELDDFDFSSDEVLSTATALAGIDTTTFFTKSDNDFEDFIAIETLQIDDKFADMDDAALKQIVDAVQTKETQTSVVDLFEDFDKFAEVIKTIDTSTFATTATTAFGKFDEYIEEQKKAAEAEKKEIEAEKAKNADGYSITLPYKLYGVDAWTNNNAFNAEYWEAALNADNTLDIKKYGATSTGWVNASADNNGFELSTDGSWVADKFDDADTTKTIEILDDKRILLKLDGVDYEKLKLFESDISGQTIYDDELKTEVVMPEGSKRVLMSIERLTDTYGIYDIQKNHNNDNETAYTSFNEFITGQCGDRWFIGNYESGYAFKHSGTQTATENNGWNQYTCDSDATSGTIVEVRNKWNGQYYTNAIVNQNAGTWKIETIRGQSILVVKPNNPFKYSYDGGLEYPIFAVKDGKVWSGKFEPKGDGASWFSYNKTAVEAVKTKALELYNAYQSNGGNSGGDNNGGDDSSGGGDSSSTTFTITGHTPISINANETKHNNGVELSTLADGDTSAQFKIVNWSEVQASNLGITIQMNSDSGNYVATSNPYQVHVHPNGNTGTVTVILQAKNSSGIESNTVSFTVTVNPVGSLTINTPSSVNIDDNQTHQINLTALSEESGLEFKIINYSPSSISDLGISFNDNTDVGSYAVRTTLNINPNGKSGSITSLQLQARNSSGVESNIVNFGITINPTNNNSGSSYTSFAELVAGRCYDGANNNSWFLEQEGNNNIKLAFECPTSQTTSGNVISFDNSTQSPSTQTAGTWAVETVQGTAVLVVNTTTSGWDDDKTIFAIKDGFVWQGQVEAQPVNAVYASYNATAGDAIKNTIISVTSDGNNDAFNTVPEGATEVGSMTAFTSTDKLLYFEFEYDTYNNLLKADGMRIQTNTTTVDKEFKYENGSWVCDCDNGTEYTLTNGAWVDNSTDNYSVNNDNSITLGQYGTFRIYTKDISSTSVQILGDTITMPSSGAKMFFFKRISQNTPDVYYLGHKVQ